MSAPTPFEIDVPQAAVDDLQWRADRWPDTRPAGSEVKPGIRDETVQTLSSGGATSTTGSRTSRI